MCLLHASYLQIFEDHFGKGFHRSVFGTILLEPVDQLVVLVHAQHAVRAKALDGEGARDANLFVVRIGFIVEVFELGLVGDGGVDVLLPGDAGVPPF